MAIHQWSLPGLYSCALCSAHASSMAAGSVAAWNQMDIVTRPWESHLDTALECECSLHLPSLSHSLCRESSSILMRSLRSFKTSARRMGYGVRRSVPMQTLDKAFSGFVNLDKPPPLVGEASQLWLRPCSFICIYVLMKYMLHRVTYV